MKNMGKVTFTNWNMFSGKDLKKMYKKEQLIDFADDLIDTQIGLIGDKLSDMGIHMCTTGTIKPEHYKAHQKTGSHIGLKVWVTNDTDLKEYRDG